MTTDLLSYTAVYVLALTVLLGAGCTPTEPSPADLIHTNAESEWCRAEVDGAPVLKPEVHAEVCR